jgi:hypothetical protein
MSEKRKTRHGKLRIDVPLEDALRAALEVKPGEKPKRKRPNKKR